MDPFFVELNERRKQNIEDEVNRIVDWFKAGIMTQTQNGVPYGRLSFRSINLNPGIETKLRERIGSVTVEDSKEYGDLYKIYTISW